MTNDELAGLDRELRDQAYLLADEDSYDSVQPSAKPVKRIEWRAADALEKLAAERERIKSASTPAEVVIAVAMLHSIAGAYTVAQSYKDAAKAAIKVIEALRIDRDEWKRQHENLLAVKEQDNKALTDRLSLYDAAARKLPEYPNRYRPADGIGVWQSDNGDLVHIDEYNELRTIATAALAREQGQRKLHTMRMAAISTAAIINGSDLSGRIGRDNPYWTPSYQDVCNAVDREIKQRERAEKAEARAERLTDAGKLALKYLHASHDERLTMNCPIVELGEALE